MVKPVPARDELRETVVLCDEGFLVWDKIAVIDVDGLLVNSGKDGLFGTAVNPVSLFLEKLENLEDSLNRRARVRVIRPAASVVSAPIIMARDHDSGSYYDQRYRRRPIVVRPRQVPAKLQWRRYWDRHVPYYKRHAGPSAKQIRKGLR